MRSTASRARTLTPDLSWMRRALALARRGYGRTSPNPMVGAVLVRGDREIGRGWHHQAGQPHAEIEALRDAAGRGNPTRGATLYVSLEPCSTHGRTPPCTDAILAAGLRRVVIGAIDPNPRHRGKGLALLRAAGLDVIDGILADEATELNETFNHWIVHRRPFVTVKAAMTLDGKIATRTGESKWITGERARAEGMRLRRGADAILVGVQTVLADDPQLTTRDPNSTSASPASRAAGRQPRRIVLDSRARTPLDARIVRDGDPSSTLVVVTPRAPRRRVESLKSRVSVWESPESARGGVDLPWLLRRLGEDSITHLLVEGGGEVNASFLEQRLAQRVAFFYAPKVLGGADARRAVAGIGAESWASVSRLEGIRWRRLGPDLYLTATLRHPTS